MSSKEDSSKGKDGTVTINIEEFTRTRDSVLVSLAQLNSAVADLSRAYINHANTALGRNPADLDLGIISSGITQSLYDNGLITRPASPGAKSEAGGDKRKRKRAPPDPNAPKRALTPYFLYMQHNRAQIAEDLGSSARPKEVAEEGTRRWSNMPEAQKAVWKKIYLDNLAVYREKMNDYKEKKGLDPHKHDHDQAASNQLQQDAAATEAGSDDEHEHVSEEEEQHEEEEEEEASPSPEPVKEPSPPRSGKRRRSEATKAAAKVAESPAPAKSPEKKKRGAAAKKDKEEEAPASTRKAADTKRPKKKRKSEAGEE